MSSPSVIQDAVEQLYQVFAKYPLAEETGPCSGCHSPQAEELLRAESLRNLQWKHLREFANDAFLTWGDLDDFKHLLPRIFDLVLNASEWSKTPSPESVFAKLRYGEWWTWPEEEHAAIERMLAAVWQTVLSNPPIVGGFIEVELWLCCIAQCVSDLEPYLNQWMEDDRPSACWALSSLILSSSVAYQGRNHRDAWWDRCEEHYSCLQKWVRSDAVIEKLRRAETCCASEEMAAELRIAQKCVHEAWSMRFEPVYRQRLYQTAYWDAPCYRLY